VGLYKKKQFAITNAQWTAISVADYVADWGLKSMSGTSFSLRSDPNDATTEDTVPGANQEVCAGIGSALFPPNQAMIYAKSSVASDTLMFTYICEPSPARK
jgi:hypothetical protein